MQKSGGTLPSVQILMDRLPSGPWIFGRQVDRAPGVPDGSLVEVLDGAGRFAGHGLYNSSSDIRLRMLHRGKRSAMGQPRQFLQRSLAESIRLRRKVLRIPDVSDAWRAVFAEGDDLPGLIIDHFAGHFVCEHHSLGFWNLREELDWALDQLHPGHSVVHRMPQSAARAEGTTATAPEGSAETVWITEHGLRFPVDLARGHKTGWFCDQRDNRQRVAGLAKDRTVLDLCCNRGGFALHAVKAGAKRVTAVDLDEVALEGAMAAGKENRMDVDWQHADAFDVLRSSQNARTKPNLIVLDPHKLIRGQGSMDEGRRKYSDLNALALQALAPGGLLATFSCSGALDLPGFLGIVFQSARRAERNIRLLQVWGAAPDHPQRPEFPRGAYLKGALCAVDA